MTATNCTAASPLLVAIVISKHRHEVLVGIPGKKRRRRLTIRNTLEDFERLTGLLHGYDLPAQIGFEATGSYHRPLAHHLGQAGFEVIFRYGSGNHVPTHSMTDKDAWSCLGSF